MKGNDIAPLIFTLGTSWRWAVNSPGKNPGTNSVGGWMRPRSGTAVSETRKTPLPRFEKWTVHPQLVAIPSVLSRRLSIRLLTIKEIHVKNQSQDLLNTVMCLRVAWKVGNLTTWWTIRLSKSVLLHTFKSWNTSDDDPSIHPARPSNTG
jgi:hypothetical protein